MSIHGTEASIFNVSSAKLLGHLREAMDPHLVSQGREFYFSLFRIGLTHDIFIPGHMLKGFYVSRNFDDNTYVIWATHMAHDHHKVKGGYEFQEQAEKFAKELALELNVKFYEYLEEIDD